ncbi:MAG TPA: IPT/TIG domain-containing protein, partial [Burkholderiaceae bacterium]
MLAVLACGLAAWATAHASDATYRYDQLGRLLEIVTGDGKSARYKYDTAGNLTDVINLAVGKVTIIDFAPRQGPVGMIVAITGTGFNADPAQDVVTFNGVPAQVTSASPSQLQVKVPDGATTGSIKVSNGANTATSTTSFTVTKNAGLPTITSFTPDTGTAGDAIGISGTNFDLTLSTD